MCLVMKKNLPDISDAVAIAREIMIQLFTSGDRQKARGAEHIWRILIVTRNCALERQPGQKYHSDNGINIPLREIDLCTE